MDMTLSKRGDYVVRSAISLARAFEGRVPRKIREVVSEMGVPQTFASQILADLVRAGIASSRAGRNGGYWLARAPGTSACSKSSKQPRARSVQSAAPLARGPVDGKQCAPCTRSG